MVMMMMMIVTATIYCLDDGLRAFSLCQDPFALPLGGPHPAMVAMVAKGSSLEPWSSVATGKCLGATEPHVAGVISL